MRTQDECRLPRHRSSSAKLMKRRVQQEISYACLDVITKLDPVEWAKNLGYLYGEQVGIHVGVKLGTGDEQDKSYFMEAFEDNPFRAAPSLQHSGESVVVFYVGANANQNEFAQRFQQLVVPGVVEAWEQPGTFNCLRNIEKLMLDMVPASSPTVDRILATEPMAGLINDIVHQNSVPSLHDYEAIYDHCSAIFQDSPLFYPNFLEEDTSDKQQA